MKNYINTWAKMIKESCGEPVNEYISDDKEWDEPGRDFGKTYGEIRRMGHERGGSFQTEKEYKEKKFITDYIDRFVIVDTKIDRMYPTSTHVLYIKKDKDGNPANWMTVMAIDSTIPFKSTAEAEKFIELFKDLPKLGNDSMTLGMYNDKPGFKIVPMRKIASERHLAESGDGNAEQITENNDIPGKRYDWKPDFQFTNEVINDLKQRDLLRLGNKLEILVPVNREDGPTYYHNDTVYDYYDRETRKNVYRPADIHDNEVYDILHVSLQFDLKNKSIGIDRYYGHRKDWSRENHTSTERDWTDVPPLTKSTVDSIINAYKDRGVFENLKKAADEYVRNKLQATAHYDVDRSLERQLNSGSQDPKFLEWVKKYTKQFSNDYLARFLRAFCAEVENGNVFSYKYNFFEPEMPTEEYIKNKLDEHTKYAKRISDELGRYYDEASKYGRNTGD